MRILVSDPLAQDGIDLLQRRHFVDVQTDLSEDQVVEIMDSYDALIVRSGTQVTAPILQAGKHLQVVARAGVGVDNIDVDAATAQGILVVNAPDGNSIAAAEHTIAMMMALTRHIPAADASMRAGKWSRKQFMGIEVTGKTLGVVGLGRIGREVARRARGLEMRVLGFDPYISSTHAERLGVELCDMERLVAEADFVTVHVPLTPATKGMIGEAELARVKPTARIINCARGGIVDEAALDRALRNGQLAGAALDVFVDEPPSGSPLLSNPKVVLTPHLGASTQEAQVAVAVDVALQVLDVLDGKPAAHPVNAPIIPSETQAQLLPFCELAEKLGAAASQLVDKHLNTARITYAGQLAEMNTDLLRALIIKGLLQGVTEARITLVNAGLIARERGLDVSEEKIGDAGHFANLITLTLSDNGAQHVLSGTIMRGEPYIVRIDEYWLDFAARGYQLLVYNRDQPGLIGQVGLVTGRADINIAFMGVGRLQVRGEALMVLTLDEFAPPHVQAEIEALPGVHAIRLLEL
ncbi:MAG: phosphoglycerate dehydrogenase [Anaerolineae bacterium]|nr:phosphoglycerate dehydrogenase [Anaerolineae bacterium]